MRIMVLSLSLSAASYAYEIYSLLEQSNLKEIGYDVSDRKIVEKMSECAKELVPCIIIVGEKEKNDRSICLRALGYEQPHRYSLIDGLHILLMKS